jgi:hypothetical protein
MARLIEQMHVILIGVWVCACLFTRLTTQIPETHVRSTFSVLRARQDVRPESDSGAEVRSSNEVPLVAESMHEYF